MRQRFSVMCAGLLLLAGCGDGLVGKTIEGPKDLIAVYPDYLLLGTLGSGAGPFTVTSEEFGERGISFSTKSGQSHSYTHEAYLAYDFRVIHCEDSQGKEKIFILRTIRKVDS